MGRVDPRDIWWEQIQDNLRSYAEYGAKARHLIAPGACPTCAALDGQEYDPLEAPRIPVEGCTNDVCRCDYTPALPA